MNLVKKIQAFLRRPFVRNVTIVASGTAAAQVITMAFSPLITRIYGPEAFGLLGIFQSLVAILAPIAALAYPIAIVLPKEDSEAKGLVKLSFLVSATIFCAVVVVMLTGGEKLLALLDSEAIAPYVMLIPLSMVFAAHMQIGQQWLIRKKQFAITARVAVLQSFLLNSAITVIGWSILLEQSFSARNIRAWSPCGNALGGDKKIRRAYGQHGSERNFPDATEKTCKTVL